MENSFSNGEHNILLDQDQQTQSYAPLLLHEDDEYTDSKERGLLPSFEELRNDLLSRVDAPNFRNRIRSQIRASLALHLTPQNVLTAKPASVMKDGVLELSNAICAQHLLASSCDFTLSVFIPEAMLNPEIHPMSLSSLLVYLRVQYPDLEQLAASSNRSLLSLLVAYLPVASESISARFSEALKLRNILKYNAGSQTDSVREDVLELQTKLYDLKLRSYKNVGSDADLLTKDRQKFLDDLDREDAYLWNRFRIVLDLDEIKSQLNMGLEDALDTPQQIAAAFRKFRKKIELEMTASVSKEKEEEFQVKLDAEKKHNANELSMVKKSFQSQLQEQLTLGEEWKTRNEEVERKLQTEKGNLEQQLQALTSREKAFDEKVQINKRLMDEKEQDLIHQAKKLSDLTEVLQARENAIQNTINTRVGELLHIQSQHLEDRENKLRREETVLNKLKDQLTKTIIDDSSDPNLFMSSPMEPKPFLQKIKAEFSRLHRENEKFKARLSSNEDNENWARIKDQLERKVRNLKTELAFARNQSTLEKQEHIDIVRELTEKCGKTERDMDLLRKESEMVKEKVALEYRRWESEKDRLKSLAKEKGRKIELLKHEIKEKDERIENLSTKLARLQGISTQTNWIMSQHSSSGNTGHSTNHARVDHSVPDRDFHSSEESGLSLKSIVDAKERIRALEKEASTMQQQFSQYRRLVSNQFSSNHTVSSAEPAKKLLLTQYLIQDKPRPSVLTEDSALLSYTPPIVSGLSGGDLGKKSKSLQLELAEVEEHSSRKS